MFFIQKIAINNYKSIDVFLFSKRSKKKQELIKQKILKIKKLFKTT